MYTISVDRREWVPRAFQIMEDVVSELRTQKQYYQPYQVTVEGVKNVFNEDDEMFVRVVVQCGVVTFLLVARHYSKITDLGVSRVMFKLPNDGENEYQITEAWGIRNISQVIDDIVYRLTESEKMSVGITRRIMLGE